MLFLQIFSINKTCPVFYFLSDSPVLSWLPMSPFLLWVFLLKFPTKLNTYLQVLQNQWRIQCTLYSVRYTSVKFPVYIFILSRCWNDNVLDILDLIKIFFNECYLDFFLQRGCYKIFNYKHGLHFVAHVTFLLDGTALETDVGKALRILQSHTVWIRILAPPFTSV